MKRRQIKRLDENENLEEEHNLSLLNKLGVKTTCDTIKQQQKNKRRKSKAIERLVQPKKGNML